MPKKNYYTELEIALCAKAALHASNKESVVEEIHAVTNRPESSIKMKIQNFASMLDENSRARSPIWGALTGKTTGESGRMTNWDQVNRYSNMSLSELDECIKGMRTKS